jgi:hypothetical protein
MDLPSHAGIIQGWHEIADPSIQSDTKTCVLSDNHGSVRQVTKDWIYFKNPMTGNIEQVTNTIF